MLVALGTIASNQSKGTQATAQALTQLLNYAASHPDATVRYTASNMYLHIHSDASYLSEAKAQSRDGGTFFLTSRPPDTSATPEPNAKPPPHNGAIHTISSIMRNVLASATEAELGAVFHKARDCIPLRIALQEMGHPQAATPIQTDNACALVLPTKQSNNADPKQSTCVSTVSAIESNKVNSSSIGVPVKTISPTTLPSIIPPPITN
jgi:hypothetical protein